uniref:Alpha-1,3-mannosyl-glycoprotein 2-beta-N-acetylglucosaminyltransferase n=1 Tax=Caenorhabditis tropicalis TaxID=1561998 RepID=A0A1I7UHV1_9PELO
MMTRRTWEELELIWPGGFWDDWMREPEQRKGRQCIRPEISRTGMTKDGRKGLDHQLKGSGFCFPGYLAIGRMFSTKRLRCFP